MSDRRFDNDSDVTPEADTDAKANKKADPELLEQEIEQIRDHLGGLVTELDHRRHRLSPVAIIRRNRWPIAIGGAILVGATIGGIAWRHARAQRIASLNSSLLKRGKRLGSSVRASLREALGAQSETVAVRPNIGFKILTAAATAVTAVAARRLATRFFERTS